MTLINRDKEVDIEILEQLLSYDPETGIQLRTWIALGENYEF